MTGCQCIAHCRYPDVGDPEVRAQHLAAHVGFALWAAERADAHGFTEPTPREIVRMVGAEFDVPRSCPRREHASLPRHPMHAA